MRNSAALFGAVLLFAGVAAARQTPSASSTPAFAGVGDCVASAAQSHEAEKQSGTAVRICGPSGPGFHSTAEATAFHDLQTLGRDPQATPDAVNAAVAKFIAAWPDSDFLAEATNVALRYHAAHGNYPGMLTYGHMALQDDPRNMYTLSVMAISVSGHVQDSDVDRDQRLAEAEQDANLLLAVLQTFTWDPVAGVDVGGRHYAPAEADATKRQYTHAAYAALGRVAFSRHLYPIAIANYQHAIESLPVAQTAVDYYYRAKSEAALGQNGPAADDYRVAIANAGANATLAGAARRELDALSASHGR